MSLNTPTIPNRNSNTLPVHRWQTQVWIGAALFFLLPVVGQFTIDDFQWGPGDFVIFAVMLAVLCSLYEIAAWISDTITYRVAAGIVLLSSFALVFINLAVGIIGSEDHPANMMYFAVVLAGFLAALFVRFSAIGMVWVMTGMASAQVVVAIIGASVQWASPDFDRNMPLGTLVVSGAFALVWLAAAALFHAAAKATPAQGTQA